MGFLRVVRLLLSIIPSNDQFLSFDIEAGTVVC
jgi:hypothetical protein